MNRTVTHVFLDLGNILVSLRAGKKLRALARKAGQDLTAFCERIWSDERSQDYERGKHTCTEYFSMLAKQLDLTLTEPALREAFCDIFQPLPERVAIARQLATHHPLGLISNTCAAHIRHLEANFDFFSLFQTHTYSHQVGFRKPHPKIYEHALAAAGARPESSLFVDDLPENLEVPARMGWQTIHLPPKADLAEALRRSGILLP